MHYRDDQGLTCTRIYCGSDYLGYVFFFAGDIPGHPERSNRWYTNAHLGSRACNLSGYATIDEARAALIAGYEADFQPAVVVTPSGLQTLIPGCEPAPEVKGDATQQRMF